MNIYNTVRSSEFRKAKRIVNNIEWTSPESFLKLVFDPNPEIIEINVSFTTVLTYYEGIGVLVREGLISIRLIALLMAGEVRRFWERLAPIVDGVRDRTEYPRLWSETEYLYDELMKYIEEHPELKT